jgi:FMN phosphatase YigB (HAD superfamily)
MARSQGRPALFIGSSAEGLPVARQFHEALAHDLTPTLWAEPGTFVPSEYTLVQLDQMLDRNSFALFVLSPDDIQESRGNEAFAPRDNVIFELGLFIGRHGRHSVFFALPDSPEIKLPTDIKGLTPVRYRTSSVDGVSRFEVSSAVGQILRVIQHRQPARSPQPMPSPFWDVLSDTIVVLYGVESEDATNKRHRVSLRDLDTAWELKSFLDRRYPAKRVWPMPTNESWERLMRTDADLVVVGGFVTNTEFAKHRTSYERYIRLRMGRLCVVEGQRIHLPKFVSKRGIAPPRRDDPQTTEDYPTNLTSRDFGFVFNGPLKTYGRERRVVAIAGIKGHGTRAAALFVTDERNGIDRHLEGQVLQNDETLELAVAAEVDSDVVDRVDPIRILLNGKSLLSLQPDLSEPCELGRSCDGCDFGSQQTGPRQSGVAGLGPATNPRAIVFDLDDTLLDTFNSLIVPLEMRAAKAMIDAGAKGTDTTRLASALLRLRRTSPANLEKEVSKIAGVDRNVLAERRKLLEPSLESVVVSPEVVQLLRQLRNRYELYLLTSGKPQFQKEKIDRLDIGKLFVEVIVVSGSSASTKANAIRALTKRRGFTPENLLIVGNRLDNEIAAGNLLSMPTVWIRHGEGSKMTPGPGTARPSVTLDSVLDLESILPT